MISKGTSPQKSRYLVILSLSYDFGGLTHVLMILITACSSFRIACVSAV